MLDGRNILRLRAGRNSAGVRGGVNQTEYRREHGHWDDPDAAGRKADGGQRIVRGLIQTAYDVRPFEIVAGPGWIDSARYDIETKAEGNPGRQEMVRMLQALLEDRFQLRVHRETRDLPVYTLAAAKSGLKLGTPRDGDCTVAGSNPAPPQPKASGQPRLLPCGRVMARISLPTARLAGAHVEMADLTRVLSDLLWRPVIDKTGRTAKFDMEVEFAADDALGILAGPYRPDVPPSAPAEPGKASIFTAIKEQLGLKLEAGKAPVDVIVIDRIERPSGN